MWRCSQPLSGIRNRNGEGDVKVLNQISQMSPSKRLTIFDARARVAATANQLRGGGFEDVNYYTNVSLKFCGIMNIHTVRKNHNNVEKLYKEYSKFDNLQEYGPAIEETNYY